MIRNAFILLSSILFSCVVPGCASSTTRVEPVRAPAPQVIEPFAKTGNPYVIKGITYYPLQSVSTDYEEVGMASWYGKDFHSKQTANGEIYDMHAMTAAHKTLPMPTYVQVTNLENNKSTVVRVNDRGPFSKGRIIDLSFAAAKELDMVDTGLAKVHITVLSQTPEYLLTEDKTADINSGSFAVQIGAFLSVANANRLAAQYQNAVTVNGVVDGKTYYRVLIRGYKTKHEAEKAADAFTSEYAGAFVIAY